MKRKSVIRSILVCVLSVLLCTSCGSEKERQIEYVQAVEEHNGPVDSLMIELDGLMQQYAAALSRSEQGEDVGAHLRALQAKVVDYGLKVEMFMHDASEEDIERFNTFYDECLERMGMTPTTAVDSIDVAF